MELSQSFEDNEDKRLKELESFSIMETPPEEVFDQLTFLAAQICQTPIALLGFVDEKRQWFKSTFGLKQPDVPRHMTACNQIIQQSDVFEIPDVANSCDCPFREYLLKLGLHYYAGVPIITKNGYHIGALCVLDYEPRRITPEQLKSLQIISSQITDVLDMRREFRGDLEKLARSEQIGKKRLALPEDLLQEAGIRAMAELSAGLIYRLKPLTLSTKKTLDRWGEIFQKNKEKVEPDLKLMKIPTDTILSILDVLSKFIEAEKEKWMKPFEINEVVKNVLAEMTPLIKENKAQVKTFLGPEVRAIGHPGQIHESIAAVIRNAVEAVEESLEKNITIEVKEEAHKAVIIITDTGTGIPPKNRPFIFQPFFSTKKKNSLGIGLSLAKALTQRHKGNVELMSEKSPTIFKLWLPVP